MFISSNLFTNYNSFQSIPKILFFKELLKTYHRSFFDYANQEKTHENVFNALGQDWLSRN